MPKPLLRRATPSDAGALVTLLGAAGTHLARQGFRNWESGYPLEAMQRDIHERTVFVVALGADTVATFTLCGEPTHPYTPEPWPEPAVDALYLNRMAVLPTHQGSGLGGWCLARIEEHAGAEGAGAVRCDVFAHNARVRSFYERFGYRAWGSRAHSGLDFRCYEWRPATLSEADTPHLR
jgi:ribosomal protein S18 acetylase RimI-like enzyme